MPHTETLLDLNESAKRTGVSAEMIKQYADCGLLERVVEGNETFFRETDVENLFGFGITLNPDAKRENTSRKVAVPKESVPEPEDVWGRAGELSRVRELSPHSETSTELAVLNRELLEQIAMLREERDWLRTRVEKLEDRLERDQMLLLSESATVRALVGSPESKREGIWAKALPWFREKLGPKS